MTRTIWEFILPIWLGISLAVGIIGGSLAHIASGHYERSAFCLRCDIKGSFAP